MTKKSHTKNWHLQHWYIKKKKFDDCENIYSVNPLYLFIDHANRYIEEKDLNPLYLIIDHAYRYIKEKSVNKHLVFDSTDENKELLKIHNDVWNGIKNEIKEVDNNEFDHEKDYNFFWMMLGMN